MPESVDGLAIPPLADEAECRIDQGHGSKNTCVAECRGREKGQRNVHHQQSDGGQQQRRQRFAKRVERGVGRVEHPGEANADWYHVEKSHRNLRDGGIVADESHERRATEPRDGGCQYPWIRQ